MQVFLEGVKAALTADAKFQGGWYSPNDLPVTGLRAAARVYAGWGFSQPFYWQKVCYIQHQNTCHSCMVSIKDVALVNSLWIRCIADMMDQF